MSYALLHIAGHRSADTAVRTHQANKRLSQEPGGASWVVLTVQGASQRAADCRGRGLGSQFHGSLFFPKVVGNPNLPLLILHACSNRHLPGILASCRSFRTEFKSHLSHLCVALGVLNSLSEPQFTYRDNRLLKFLNV